MRLASTRVVFAAIVLTAISSSTIAHAQISIPPVGVTARTGPPPPAPPLPGAAAAAAGAAPGVWFPLRGLSQDEDERFYGLQKAYGFIPQVRWFSEGLGGGQDGVTNSISADVLSAVVKQLRLAIGTSVTPSTTVAAGVDPEATLQQLTRGGNLYVTGAYPLLRTPVWTTDDPTDAKLRVAAFVLPQLSAVVPEFSATAVTSTIYALDVGVEATVDYSNDKAGVFASGRTGPVFLSSGFETLAPGVATKFWMTQWALGVQLLGVRVSLQGLLGDPSEIRTDRSVRLVFQLLPK